MRARDNPFRAEVLQTLPFVFPPGDSLSACIHRLESLNWRGAVVGPHGAGKTTILDQLSQELNRRGMPVSSLRLQDVRWTRNRLRVQQWLSSTPAASVLILDSAGLFPRLAWNQFVRTTSHYRGLIISCHKAGRLPTILNCTPSLDLLIHLVEQLVGPGVIANAQLAELFHRHQGNLRACLRALYDEYASQETSVTIRKSS